MSGTVLVPIRDLVSPVSTWNPLKPEFGDNSFEYIDLSAVDQELKSVTGSRTISCADAPSRARQLVRANDVIVSTVRPNLNGVAMVPAELDGATASTGFCLIRAKQDVLEPSYVFHWVKSQMFVNKMVNLATGASYPAVSDRIVLDSEIPLPTLAEQRRIASILDKADALRVKRREALAQIHHLAQSIFVEMFGDPKAHAQRPLEQLCDLITDGTHQTPTYTEEGVIFLSAKNVTSGEIDWKRIKFIPESLHLELHRRLAPRRGDILLAKNGTTGIAAVVDRDCIFDIYVSLALLRPKTDVLPAYLLAAINSPLCTRQFAQALKGIGVPNLHLKEIRQTTVPYPSLNEQQDFVERMSTLSALKEKCKSALVEAEALFSSLQNRAFVGKL